MQMSDRAQDWGNYKSRCENSITDKITTEVGLAISAAVNSDRFNDAFEESLAQLRISTEKSTAELCRDLTSKSETTQRNLCCEVKEQTSEPQKLITEYKANRTDYPQGGHSPIIKEDWITHTTRLDQLSCKVDMLAEDLRKYARTTDSLDLAVK